MMPVDVMSHTVLRTYIPRLLPGSNACNNHYGSDTNCKTATQGLRLFHPEAYSVVSG
jgi:hypothetical protein